MEYKIVVIDFVNFLVYGLLGVPDSGMMIYRKTGRHMLSGFSFT